jgi:hypothetical protein
VTRRLAAALLPFLLLATACSGGDDGDPITSATYTQMQALPDFEARPGTQEDPDELARLATILEDAGLDGATESLGELCPGGRTTQVAWMTEGGRAGVVQVQGCERGDDGDAIDALVAEWTAAG